MNKKRVPSLGLSIFGYMVFSASVVGYFVGLQSPMRSTSEINPIVSTASNVSQKDSSEILATSYAEIGDALRTHRGVSKPVSITSPLPFEQDHNIQTATSEEKAFALKVREQNRAYNGAPPTIPHTTDRLSTEACIACHGEGIRTESLRASRMSHAYHANCTQCHVEQNPRDITAAVFKSNSFLGLAAPDGGPRAYASAPPQIPHSTLMRSNCLSCHGSAGNRGLQTTHPWRKNCLQCHTPSAASDQIPAARRRIVSSPTFNC